MRSWIRGPLSAAVAWLACANAVEGADAMRLDAGATRLPTGAQDAPVLVFGPRTPVDPPRVAHHRQVMVFADPESADTLVVSGARANPERAAGFEGYVYRSGDGGRSWREVLVDTSSQWVSEESFTFGSGHQAWFVASASDSTRGTISHPRGTARLYRSPDGGRTWTNVHTGAFMDWTAMSVDRTAGPNRGSLYIFANHVADGYNEWRKENMSLVTRREVPASRFSMVSRAAEGGHFPTGTGVLKDGTVVAVIWAQRKVADPDGTTRRVSVAEFISSPDGGATLTEPVTIAENASVASFALDETTDEMFVAWMSRSTDQFPDSDARRQLMLARSTDHGHTWITRPVNAPAGQSIHLGRRSPSIAINAQGALGFLWYGDERQAYFAASLDRGASLVRIVELTPGSNAAQQPLQSISGAMNLAVLSADKNITVRVDGGDGMPFGWSNTPFGNGLVADVSGVFHPVWAEVANGPGQLYTRSVAVTRDRPVSARLEPAGLDDLTERVVLHSSSVRYDRLGELCSFDIAVTNRSEGTLAGRLRAVMEGDVDPAMLGKAPQIGTQQSFNLRTTNSDNGQELRGAAWDLRSAEGVLRSGQSTEPRTLTFRCGPKQADGFGSFGIFSLHVYGAPAVNTAQQ